MVVNKALSLTDELVVYVLGDKYFLDMQCMYFMYIYYGNALNITAY